MADSTTSTVTRQDTPVGYRTQLVNLVVDRMQHSLNHFTTIRREIPQLYDLYRGLLTGRFVPYKNNVHIPLIFSTIQSDVARKCATSFSQWPIVRFLGYGPDDAPIARKREALISAQMRDAGSFRKAYELFLTADLYGTTVAQYGWNHVEQEMLVTFRERLPISGFSVQRSQVKDVITFDGPNWKVLDLLDCFPQPGYCKIEDMQWFVVREYMDLDDVRRNARFSEDGLTVFDPVEVARMEREGIGSPPSPDDYKTMRSLGRTIMDQDGRNREPYSRPVEILNMIGVIPSELVPPNSPQVPGWGLVHRIVTVANRRYLLRNRPNPFWNGKKNLLAYSPMPDPHYFYAPGKAEVAKKLQIIANRFTNQQLDALDIFIDPAFFYNSNSNLNTRNLLMRPGKFIPLDGEPSANVQAVVPNLQGVQLGGQMTEVVWRWMQQGMGIIEDTVMGGGQGSRQTAREFVGRSEAVATRLMLESRLFEEDFLEPLADTFVDLNRQFLDLPREVMILGDNAKIDPVTGQPIEDPGRTTIDGYDLVPNYDAHAVGATTQLNKSQRRQDTAFLIQAMSANPITASAVNWINFFKDVLRLFDYDNVNEIINSEPQMQKVLQLAGQGPETQAQDIPGTPTGPAGIQDLSNFLGQGIT